MTVGKASKLRNELKMTSRCGSPIGILANSSSNEPKLNTFSFDVDLCRQAYQNAYKRKKLSVIHLNSKYPMWMFNKLMNEKN